MYTALSSCCFTRLVSVVLLLLAPLLVSCQLYMPTDCSVIYDYDNSLPSGVYTIYPAGPPSAVQVYCDMDSDGGRWTMFQRRMDGTVNFYRDWNKYVTGFGNPAGEYWLGLQSLMILTDIRKCELLVNMEDFEGHKAFARYSSFFVDRSYFNYTLRVSGFTDGGAGDSLSYHSGMTFSTFDQDRDGWNGNCAKSHLGGFWYRDCHNTNPNGVYRRGADSTLDAVGVEWATWKGRNYSLKFISMKIRPVQ
ncbi:microfibril-associated glycoprotein 4-like [Perca flavescens]|uniref:microfibril-associated glycoprotein 4-like n=1 Tax=Perca flavescens TaxID=8167 RepID=UPI00106E4523|nr:microfibril-associated glycoprotein 4-like [Perca flavescens]